MSKQCSFPKSFTEGANCQSDTTASLSYCD